MGWPQWVAAGWMFVVCGFALAMDGKPMNMKYSFWRVLILEGAWFAVLAFGGFWRHQ